MTEIAERKYPHGKDFKECPVCKSTERIAEAELNHLKQMGKARPETLAYLFNHQSMIRDSTKLTITVPVVITYYDVCVECGTVYCIHFEINMAMPQIGSPPPGSMINPASS